MKGNVQNASDKVLNEMKAILKKMKQSFSDRYDCILKDEFILASATFLNLQYFSCSEFDEILPSAIKIKDCYSEQLVANGCNIDHLNAELRILCSHVSKFLSNVTSSKCWPRLFKLKEGLGNKNILHIAEICISIPLSNAECKHILSFLWRQLTKDRLSMNNKTLERIFQFRFGTGDYSIKQYDHAIDLFLTEYPDRTVRKKQKQPDGHNYPS